MYHTIFTDRNYCVRPPSASALFSLDLLTGVIGRLLPFHLHYVPATEVIYQCQPVFKFAEAGNGPGVGDGQDDGENHYLDPSRHARVSETTVHGRGDRRGQPIRLTAD